MTDTEQTIFESNISVLSQFHLYDNVLVKKGNVKTFGVIKGFFFENGKVCLWIQPINSYPRVMENDYLCVDPTLDLLYETSVIPPRTL